MIFQDPITSLDPVFTVGSLLKEVIMVHRDVSNSEAEKLAIHALKEAQLPDAKKRLKNYPHELSGGMRQRVAIARAIVSDPKILILDEATSQIDGQSESIIHDSLAEFIQDRTTIVITHRPSSLRLADRVIVMELGEIVHDSSVQEAKQSSEQFQSLFAKSA